MQAHQQNASTQLTFKIHHMHLDWNILFEEKKIEGFCSLDFEILAKTEEIIFQVYDLEINRVEIDAISFPFRLPTAHGANQILIIPVNLCKGKYGRIKINYSTSPTTRALFWTSEAHNKYGQFLISQCQQIGAASSLFPCAAKMAFSASIRIPCQFKNDDNLICLMSALETNKTNSERIVHFEFKQTQISPADFFIAVGNFKKRALNDRNAIWALDDETLENAELELEDMEKMLKAPKELLGDKFAWERFDLLMLPFASAHFPFITTSALPFLAIISGSFASNSMRLANQIANHFAHKILPNSENSGLYQTFATFFERKIIGHVFGESHRWLAHSMGFKDHLKPAILAAGYALNEHEKWIARSLIQAEKGSALLLLIEQICLNNDWNRHKFYRFLINQLADGAIQTEHQFEEFLYAQFSEQKEILDSHLLVLWQIYAAQVPKQIAICQHCFDFRKNGILKKQL